MRKADAVDGLERFISLYDASRRALVEAMRARAAARLCAEAAAVALQPDGDFMAAAEMPDASGRTPLGRVAASFSFSECFFARPDLVDLFRSSPAWPRRAGTEDVSRACEALVDASLPLAARMWREGAGNTSGTKGNRP